MGQNYLDYYNQINKAKLLVVDSNYSESVLVYQKTFDDYGFEYARDCINALEISFLTSQDSLTGYFMECALKRGVPISYFINNKKLTVFKTTQYWDLLVQNAPTLNEEYQTQINTEIRNEINQMFEKDQRIRKRYYHWSNLLFRSFIAKKWNNLNTKQVNRIIEITAQFGFPGEKLIGIDIPQYHEKIDSNQFSAGMPIIIMIHHYSQPNISFDSLLHYQVILGNLYNEHFASICDFEAKFGNNKFTCYGYYGLRQQPKNYILSEFDQKRKKIGLLSSNQILKLNRSNIMTKFWNQLY
jgi:hypothetical protein